MDQCSVSSPWQTALLIKQLQHACRDFKVSTFNLKIVNSVKMQLRELGNQINLFNPEIKLIYL